MEADYHLSRPVFNEGLYIRMHRIPDYGSGPPDSGPFAGVPVPEKSSKMCLMLAYTSSSKTTCNPNTTENDCHCTDQFWAPIMSECTQCSVFCDSEPANCKRYCPEFRAEPPAVKPVDCQVETVSCDTPPATRCGSFKLTIALAVVSVFALTLLVIAVILGYKYHQVRSVGYGIPIASDDHNGIGQVTSNGAPQLNEEYEMNGM
ncbi:hypothetical protein CAPTEDRAFT_214966 [Capitella teleta]|uniref:Uncharacterized protein n=1 Tax=Capitella teleta TaxID=283909 RepID=R7T816_CAPTE|nr:hypothetical protein CAPTEDRAFT_214966 [Capitella teleta]|eukprot:ELT89799.1 hypothetical protein CAPTEDRAFT_214966 [Capitella teleta]